MGEPIKISSNKINTNWVNKDSMPSLRLKQLAVEEDICPLRGTSIMINPGHGASGRGERPFGATAWLNKKKYYEKDLNDSVATKLAKNLKQMGADVIYVDNTPLGEIQQLQNKLKPDLFVSIHHDAQANYGKTLRGETVYSYAPSPEKRKNNKNSYEKSKKAAEFINEELKQDSTVPNHKPRQNSYKVLNVDKKIPSILVEVGYMSNPTELNILTTPEYQSTAAKNIANGCRKFLLSEKPSPLK